MNIPEIYGDFNLFYHPPDQPNQNPDGSSSNEINSLEHSDIQRINQYQRELENYTNKYSNDQMNYINKQSNLLHFDFNAAQKEEKDKNLNYEKKKNKTISYSDNLSLIERIKESNLHYVGFENKNGENSCYINVVLHFLYIFPCVNEFLIEFYKKKSKNFVINNSPSPENKDYFLFLLGQTLFEYQKILSDEKKKGITILHTTELRNHLQLISKNFYSLNKVGDPVEFLTFIFDEINNKNKLEVHKYFYINLIEEIKCNNYCINRDITKYDENNFIYHIYANEILEYINNKNLNFDQYNHQLFSFAKQNSQNYFKRCKHCKNNGNTLIKLIGSDYPEYFLLNCVWNNQRPELKNVLQFLYLLSLRDSLQNIFICENNKINPIYDLLGMILYSGALSHYINVRFNMSKNIFVLYNDDKIKELSSIHEVYKEITAEEIKNNIEAFYYPVLLIYYKEQIYNDKKTMQLNEYFYSRYKNLEEMCMKAKNRHIPLTKEQKERNHMELIQAQIRFNRTMSEDKRYKNLDMIIEEESKSPNNINIHNQQINIKSDNNMILEDEKEKIFEFEGDEEQEENKEKKRNNKRYGTDYKIDKNYNNPKINYFPNFI